MEIIQRELVHLYVANYKLINKFSNAMTNTSANLSYSQSGMRVLKFTNTANMKTAISTIFGCSSQNEIPIVYAKYGTAFNLPMFLGPTEILANSLGTDGVKRMPGFFTYGLIMDSGWWASVSLSQFYN
jgi:hypothetical protein